MEYLEFKSARCKDCFKCLRECPVKAIRFEEHQAKIIEDKCILCGKCISVCPQNAKIVHSEVDKIKKFISEGETVVSLAPSFVSSFDVKDFASISIALRKLGFSYVEETAVGANVVTEEYSRLLQSGKYKNFITSACPAINRMIQIYYPNALKYLAPVVSPMIAHVEMLKKRFPQAKIVFIGPCIAKKREAEESGIVDGVLTFEELSKMFEEKNIDLSSTRGLNVESEYSANKSKYYPISRGIIKSFVSLPKGYEYVTVDGVKRSFEVLEDIIALEGMFIEINCCEYACINGPCSIKKSGGSLKANEDVRRYVKDSLKEKKPQTFDAQGLNLSFGYPRLSSNSFMPTERDIKTILAKTGKLTQEDEYNCGACGYSTCREKAIAVANGYADIEMCIPYMRVRAEGMSYEIIHNSLSGVLVVDYDYKIIDINDNAKKILGIEESDTKGKPLFELAEADEFILAQNSGEKTVKKRIKINKTNKFVDASFVMMPEHKSMFAVLRDITDSVEYDEQLKSVKSKTIATTDDIIKKQMRVAQEIASLLGETTAETKVALIKLKQTLIDEDGNKE